MIVTVRQTQNIHHPKMHHDASVCHNLYRIKRHKTVMSVQEPGD